MWEFIANIAIFSIRQGRALFLAVGILVVIEGLLYIFFPHELKKMIESSPLNLLRLCGGFILLFGIVLILFYFRILA